MTSQSSPGPIQAYQEFYGPAIFRPLARALVAFAPPRRGARVLDLACGTGIVARELSEALGPSGSIVALDVNPAMLRAARGGPAPTGAPIEWLEADATTVALPAASFDAAYCQQGLQFFPDRPGALARLRAALRPGGQAVFATWLPIDQHPIFAAFATVEMRYLSDLGMTYDDLVAPFSLGDPEALRALLEEAGFRVATLTRHDLRVQVPDPSTFARWMETGYGAVLPAFVADAARFEAFVSAVECDTRDIVAAYTIGGDLVFTMPANFMVAVA